MDFALTMSFLGVAILLTLMPGPDILFVITQSISQDKKAGIATALGLCSGLIVHITAATLGISIIIYQSALAFTVIKYTGAAYLLYLAWQSFKEKETGFAFNHNKPLKYPSLYKKGILMNLLNHLPKHFLNWTKISRFQNLDLLFLVTRVDSSETRVDSTNMSRSL